LAKKDQCKGWPIFEGQHNAMQHSALPRKS